MTRNETLPSHDAELEEAILGACMIERQAMPLVADKLRPEMFYEEKHQEIYSTLQAMYRAGKSIDIITVKDELSARGKLQMVGGPYALTLISSKVASSVHLEYHVLILRQKFVRREMRLGFHKLLALASDETIDIVDTMVEAHNLLDRLENECGTTEHLRGMERLMEDTFSRIEARMANGKNGITGIPTGFTDLDRLTSGWQRGDLHIIAARPSVGKTAFALHLARAAASAGYHSVVYSLEMQGEQLGDRWILTVAPDVNAQHLKSGQLTPDELRQVRNATAELSRLSIQVDDHPVTSMDRVRSSARLLQSQGKCDLIILDYLQLCKMDSEHSNRNREQEVAQASRKAKIIAKELNVPVLLLSQLNRESEGRPGRRPELSDLRESGAIEQDADMVMLLYRPAVCGQTMDRKSKYPAEGLGVVIVAKHRNGETGDVYFGHNPSLTKMGDYIPPMEWLMQNSK